MRHPRDIQQDLNKTDSPHLFFMHFRANDEAQKLTRGLRSALDKVNVKKG